MIKNPYPFFDLTCLAVVDVETDELVDYTQVHCVVVTDMDGKEERFVQPSKRISSRIALKEHLKKYATVCGHNFIGFDAGALNDLLPGTLLPSHRILDTLVVSRLVNYARSGGHSLRSWGETLGETKQHAEMNDFKVYTPEMLERCISDVRINKKLVDHFMRFLVDPEWQQAILIEHDVAWAAQDMHRNGLDFDSEAARALHNRLTERLGPMDQAIQAAFPPKPKVIREITPRLTQKGTYNAQDFRWARTHLFSVDDTGRRITLGDPCADHTPDLSWVTGDSFVLVELEPFNPGSPRQIVERLNEAGWKPTDKTKGHIEHLKARRGWPKGQLNEYNEKLSQYKETGWKVSEENLKTLPDTAPPAAHLLAQRLTLASRLSDLDEWLALVARDGKLHGVFTPIGAWTHRMAHSRPNTANIPVANRSEKDTEFQKFVNDINDEMRALFIAPPGFRLLGTDADGIQMRIFAHLVGDEKLINALISGSKKDATDIHSLHQRALGVVCKSRDAAKTFIYAFLLGAGVAKVAEILECTATQAKTAVDNFLEFYPGLKSLKGQQIPRDASRGYFVGLDGRKVVCNSEHLMLAGYLQNGEKIIMAYALRLWKALCDAQGLEYSLINWVHDEWQVLIRDDDELAKRITDIQLQSFIDVGEMLDMKCPLAGTTSTHDGFIGGYSWKETH